jgi:hypothetical protein
LYSEQHGELVGVGQCVGVGNGELRETCMLFGCPALNKQQQWGMYSGRSKTANNKQDGLNVIVTEHDLLP